MPSDASNRVGAGLGSAPFCMGTLGEIRWFSEKFFDKLLLLAYNKVNGFVDCAVIHKWKGKGPQVPSGVWGGTPMQPLKEAL